MTDTDLNTLSKGGMLLAVRQEDLAVLKEYYDVAPRVFDTAVERKTGPSGFDITLTNKERHELYIKIRKDERLEDVAFYLKKN